MRRISPREARRLMKQMRLKMEEMNDVKEVIFRMENRELIVENPTVSVIEVSGQRIFQVSGGKVSEKRMEAAEKTVKVSEEDAQLIAAQLNVTLEEAIDALKEAGGNLAEAIMLIQSRRKP